MRPMLIPQTAYDQVERLVAKFKKLSTRVRREYNEDNTRKDFILPLFRALQWDIERLPIRRTNFDDPADKQQHEAIVALVAEMLELQKEHAEIAAWGTERADAVQRRIAQVDAAIDAAVYRLYDLSQEEIEVVEGKVNQES